MVMLDGGWLQWDYQLGTFRGQANGITYGVFGGQFTAASDIAAAIGESLSQEHLDELEVERVADLASQAFELSRQLNELLVRAPKALDKADVTAIVDAVFPAAEKQ
jgi:hypothetical protein